MLLFVGVTMVSCQDSSLISTDQSAKLSISEVDDKKGGNSSSIPDGLKPNSQKYNDSSMPAASGRDGEVVVTARALINSAGVTDLEVTTGTLDSEETAPGTLTKLLVKALDSDNPDIDNPVWEKNYNKLRDGGYFTTSYDNLSHGQPVFVHSNVRGIIRGTAVVRVTEIVKFRPDLSVLSIDAPSEVYVGDPVNIVAEITEGLGDLGANADCVMYVDDVETDRANGIWVDAGDAVICAFSTLFNEVGTKEVTVAVENVVPGDFDNGNNSKMVQIEVIEPSTNNFYWSAYTLIDLDPYSYYYSYQRRSSWFNYTTYYDVVYGKRQHTWINGWKDGHTGFPMDINVQVSSGDNEWINQSIAGADAGSSNTCYRAFLPYNSIIQVCDYDSSFRFNRTYIHFNRYARDVVYYGKSYYQGYYHYQYNDTLLPYGTNVTFDIQLTGANDNARLSGEILLTENVWDYTSSYNRSYRRVKGRALTGYSNGSPE